MKLVGELLIGAFVGGAAYWFAAPTTAVLTSAADIRSNASSPEKRAAASLGRRSADGLLRVPSLGAPGDSRAAMSDVDERELVVLRNEIIRVTSEDMHRRGQDVWRCLDGHTLSGPEKLRFSVRVDATPSLATTGRWQLVEIVDGEPLPETFAECAARAFGSGLKLAPAANQPFPTYHGQLSMLYTIHAPRALIESQ